MSSSASVTRWLSRLRAGDHAAAQQLWDRYFRRLVGLARKLLQQRPRRAADEEDVALSAFASFCRGAERGRFAPPLGRDNLWPLLVVITARKAHRRADHDNAKKRGGALAAAGAEGPSLDDILGREPTPEFAAQVAEEWRRLLDALGDEQLRAVAVWKMEGHTNDEIAALLGRSPRSVERKVQVIRRKLEAHEAAEGGGASDD